MKNRLYVFGALLLIAVSFQNCSKQGFESAEIGMGTQTSLEVNQSLGVAEQTGDQRVAPMPNRYVAPVSIKFGGDVLIGVVDRMANESMTTAQEYFSYNLIVRTGVVQDLSSNSQVLQLSLSERSELNAILKGSMVARATDFPLPPNAGNWHCGATFMQAFAALVTRSEIFELGGGTSVCDSLDLFRINGGERAGLREFLERIQDRIEQNVPVPPISVLELPAAITYTIGTSGLSQSPVRKVSIYVKFNHEAQTFIAQATAHSIETTNTMSSRTCMAKSSSEAYLAIVRATTNVHAAAPGPEALDSGSLHLNIQFVNGRVLEGAISGSGGSSFKSQLALHGTAGLTIALAPLAACLNL